MDPKEREERDRVVVEALSWMWTPFHHAARVKGEKGGVDCATFLAEVYERAGIFVSEVREYPPDWHLHRNEEWYMNEVLRNNVEIPGPPLPGDIVLFRVGGVYSHGAIVLDWPEVIHAWPTNRLVAKANATMETLMVGWDRKFFSHWGKRD